MLLFAYLQSLLVILAQGLISIRYMKQFLVVCAFLCSTYSYAQQTIDTTVVYKLPNVNVNTT
jgi:hypothetical protein